MGIETWQDGEKDDNDDIEDQDVGEAHPNCHPAPPVVSGHANGMQDAIPQGLPCCIGIQLVLPVTCTHTLTSSSIFHSATRQQESY